MKREALAQFNQTFPEMSMFYHPKEVEKKQPEASSAQLATTVLAKFSMNSPDCF